MNPDLSKLPVCGERWESMEPLADGRRQCTRCAHPLTDFRSMSKAEITLAHVMSDERICGVYTPEQLAPVAAEPRRGRTGLVTLALGASLLAARAEAQTTTPVAGQAQAPVAGDTAASRVNPATAAPAATAPDAQPTLVVRGSIRTPAGAPVRHAMVVVEGTERRTLTDSAGGYVLRIPAASRPLRLRFGAIGYGTVTRSVGQVAGEVQVDATLEAQVIGLIGIVVTPREPDPRRGVGYHITRIEGSKP